MAGLEVSFTLSERDVEHLRRVMRRAVREARKQPEEAIIGAALAMAEEVRKFKPPVYVAERVARLESLIEMARDADYALPAPVKHKILGALAYFTEPEDLISDPVPGLGFLDDAILIELVSRDLRHELAAYREFCRFRESARSSRLWRRADGPAELARRLADRRAKLRERVEARLAADAERARTGRGRGLFPLW